MFYILAKVIFLPCAPENHIFSSMLIRTHKITDQNQFIKYRTKHWTPWYSLLKLKRQTEKFNDIFQPGQIPIGKTNSLIMETSLFFAVRIWWSRQWCVPKIISIINTFCHWTHRPYFDLLSIRHILPGLV